MFLANHGKMPFQTQAIISTIDRLQNALSTMVVRKFMLVHVNKLQLVYNLVYMLYFVIK